MSVVIYALFCPLDKEVRYIGKANDPRRRLMRHICTAKREQTYKARWLHKLAGLGLSPELLILRTLADGDDWKVAEREEIRAALDAGARLTNLTPGGDGVRPLTPEIAAAFIEANSKHSKRIWAIPEIRAKITAGIRESKASAETRAAIGEKSRVAFADEATKLRHRDAVRAAFTRPETKAALMAGQKRAWADPDIRERHRAAMGSDQTRFRLSTSAKARWSDPEKGAAARASNSSPERRQKLSEMAKRRATPEYRAMMAEKTRLSWEKRRQNKG